MFVARVPVLAIELIEEAAMFYGKNLVGERSCPSLSCSRDQGQRIQDHLVKVTTVFLFKKSWISLKENK